MTGRLNMYQRRCKKCDEMYSSYARGSEICDECSSTYNKRIWWIERQVWGYEKCPRWLKKAYYDGVKGICQECKKKFDDLSPHRIIRATEGGLYTVAILKSKENNIKPVCNKCHKKIHSMENGCTSK